VQRLVLLQEDTLTHTTTPAHRPGSPKTNDSGKPFERSARPPFLPLGEKSGDIQTRSYLWEITSRFAATELLVSHEMEAVHHLEATTGRHCYSR